jgi:hypothetical protein
MNRTNLLATGAIVALVFATGTAMAQQERPERGGPAPVEKMAPPEAKHPPAASHHDEGQNRPVGRGEPEHRPSPEGNAETPAERHGTVGQGSAGTRANTGITADKRIRIHETIVRERNAPRVSSVKFDLSVGTRVPRDIRIAAVPQTIVEIEPAWLGFEYFLAGDEIVIVNPRTLEIVAVIDA